MTEAARPAVDSDVSRLVELSRSGLDALTQQRGGPALRAREQCAIPDEDSMRRGLHAPDRATWVGTLDDLVVGMASGHIETVEGGERIGVIDGVIVEPAARGVGVGEAMLDGLVTWFDDAGCTAADAWALPGDREAKRFFEAAGFTTRLLILRRPIAR